MWPLDNQNIQESKLNQGSVSLQEALGLGFLLKHHKQNMVHCGHDLSLWMFEKVDTLFHKLESLARVDVHQDDK